MELSQLVNNGNYWHWQAQGGNVELSQRSCESNSHLENPRSIPSLTTRSGNDWQILKHLPPNQRRNGEETSDQLVNF